MKQFNRLFHGNECRCHQSRKSDQLDIIFTDCINDRLIFHVFSEVNHVITVIFKQNLYNIFTDVVNITFDGCNDDFAFADRCGVTLHHMFTNDFKRHLCNGSCHNQLRQEQRSLFKVLADFIQCRNQHFIDNYHGVIVF